MKRVIASLLHCCGITLFAIQSASAVTMDWSPVGNPGNAADSTGFGAVNYAYNIGTYDVTNNQYVELLNTKDPTGDNVYGLYSSDMSNPTFGGINYDSNATLGNKYSVIAGAGDHPVNFVSWYDAIRFANWLNNGQGPGADTETGAYTLGALGPGGIPIDGDAITRNAGAKVFVPSENEWYKAAYYNAGSASYFKFPTSSDTIPTATGPTAAPNSANYDAAVGNLTDVFAYPGTQSPYGAFGMAGNVNQWNESIINTSFRGMRGGEFNRNAFFLESSSRIPENPAGSIGFDGFRVASIPEPSTFVLGLMSLLAIRAFRRRP